MHKYQLKHKHNCTHKEAVPISSWVMCDIFQFEICWAFVRGCLIALHFIVLPLLFSTLFCIVAETVLCSSDSFGYTVLHIVMHCIVFLILQPCVVHGYIRTQNHEVVLHFTNGESPLHVAILVSILVSIVILLYWCMDISGLKIRGVVLHRSVAALPQAWHSSTHNS